MLTAIQFIHTCSNIHSPTHNACRIFLPQQSHALTVSHPPQNFHSLFVLLKTVFSTLSNLSLSMTMPHNFPPTLASTASAGPAPGPAPGPSQQLGNAPVQPAVGPIQPQAPQAQIPATLLAPPVLVQLVIPPQAPV